MSQIDFIKRSARPGKQARNERRAAVYALTKIVKGNRSWRARFFESYPEFDNAEGSLILTYAVRGRADDPRLLEALTEWIPKIQAEQPDWFVKQLSVDVP
ncbi:MAG: hypothetical protein EAZ63_03570 [Runella slithyformis]|nr:MAG: hypothetical protein EAZ63_03570 [Runella slithyformis]